VSLSTIINRAKANGFYLIKPKRKVHEKEVITNYPGELIQHDSSHHQFSIYAADNKWYLITSLDDYSRLILYAILVERETTWTNIIALKVVILGYGIPYSYYVDSYSVYRFVQGRDSIWRNHCRYPRASPWHLKPIQASLDLNPGFFAILRILICSFHPGL